MKSTDQLSLHWDDVVNVVAFWAVSVELFDRRSFFRPASALQLINSFSRGLNVAATVFCVLRLSVDLMPPFSVDGYFFPVLFVVLPTRP